MLKQYLRFVVPSIISMLVFNIYTLVDGIFVANFVSDKALAAIGIATPYITATFSISVLFSVGASIVMSIYRGQKELHLMNLTFTMNTVVLSVIAIVISIIGFTQAEPIALFLGANEELLADVVLYIRIIALFGFFFIVSYSFEVLLKADGYPEKSIQGVCIGAITNILLDALFVVYFHWGLIGAALATGIAQCFTFLFFAYHFFCTKNSHFHFVKGSWHLKEYRRILPLGLSECINECSAGVMILAFNYQIKTMIGTSGLISFSVIAYIFNLVLMAMSGVSQGIQPMISYYHGKEDQKRIGMIHKYARFNVILLSILSFGIIWFFTPQIVGGFLDKEATEFFFTMDALRLYSFSFLILGHNVISYGILSAVECPKQSFVISVGRGMIVIIASLWIMSYLFGANGIWLSPLVSECICLVLSILFLYQKRRLIHE
ncbi:MAG: MATE family efflux transporter [Erysipelotrichaceae bacterium]|nr:MATE family efflux transporter [Erysipelotrichaceae bacterium]